eukprot:CAMPEP_0197312930 /NCGR_PEP_ID=MMETSP0891-20130614/24030_1 /TAXON_ID=44058 ORGANISM="Aureoumbra lagunensis, Strain CCMP1510" /NCGR_SAMPLE_ID=MMETSP0891 /ASSEMBLY_ACC=CAM_ASM_000534 /LENGTH=431 /DNA_ID=CAMNT_0042800429 /DNA_START=166 /DNA_END=1461 /DNA_ORIENTATION=-
MHADGSATIRTVSTNEDETKTIEDVKFDKAPEDLGSICQKKPIGPPIDLPQGARWTAKRQILTDEATGNITITIVYRITRLDGKEYTQREESMNDEPVKITKGPLEDNDKVTQEENKVPQRIADIQLDDTERDPSSTNQEDQQTKKESDFNFLSEPIISSQMNEASVVSAPSPPSSANKKIPPALPEPIESEKSALPKSPGGGSIGPPRDLPEGAGWKARRETITDGTGSKTITATYEITSAGLQWTQIEITQPDGEVSIQTSAKRPAPPGSSALGKPIPPPTNLPQGAGWKARRESFTADTGHLTIVTTYDIMHDGHLYNQIETRLGDADAVPHAIEKTDKRPAPPDALSPRSKKPVPPPQELPQGAGWKASRQTVIDERGVATTTTTYTITTRNPISYVLSEYEQIETQLGDDGPINITHKSAPKEIGY